MMASFIAIAWDILLMSVLASQKDRKDTSTRVYVTNLMCSDGGVCLLLSAYQESKTVTARKVRLKEEKNAEI